MAVEFNPGGAANLNAAVKQRYEANADTNPFTDAAEAKLAGIAAGATANSTDVFLLDRANHTGLNEIADTDGLQAALDGKQAAGDYAAADHEHTFTDVPGLQAALDARIVSDVVAAGGGSAVGILVTITEAEMAAITPNPAVTYLVTE